MSETVLGAVERLSRCIISGEVVFFIGSGFSIDSEGNTASRFMIRLLIRFSAMVHVLSKNAKTLAREISDPEKQKAAEELADLVAASPEKLRQTFRLNPKSGGRFPWLLSSKNEQREADVRILAREYYAANNWFCTVFERMLELVALLYPERTQRMSLFADVAREEEQIRSLGGCDGKPLDSIRLDAPDDSLFQWVDHTRRIPGHDAGKALFLDTMGFANGAVMGGDSSADDMRQVASSYRNKLFDRHHVLARLAREGLCPIVLTTNYDLLLEGAWRLSGFDFESELAQGRERLPDVPWERVARISSPLEFVKSGKAVRTSLVVKVHGCADLYRKVRKTNGSWRRYLESMVFTYREIQNWRQDSWTRDFLATLQRTRTVVFIGYSLQDPVIHDTFRTTYEEMARQRHSTPPVMGTADGQSCYPKSESAPAFFFAPRDGTHSFHGTEVLNAATFAVGAAPRHGHDHENYIGFYYRNGHSPASGRFPNLDDLFRWLFHCVVRQRQRQCLEHRLCGAATLLLPRRARPSEIAAILASFDEVVKHESVQMDSVLRTAAEKQAQATDNQHDRFLESEAKTAATVARRQLTETTAWTHDFHPSLLQEFACCDLVQRNGGPGMSLETVRGSPWYFPLSANLGWTAWGVVVELAVRRLLAAAAGLSDAHAAWEVRREFYPAAARFPTILFKRNSKSDRLPRAGWLESLTIQTGAFDEAADMPESMCGAGRHTVWTLRPNQAPWHRGESRPTIEERTPGGQHSRLGVWRQIAPEVEDIWRFALREVTSDDVLACLGDALSIANT